MEDIFSFRYGKLEKSAEKQKAGFGTYEKCRKVPFLYDKK
jgi:hypothetical protein